MSDPSEYRRGKKAFTLQKIPKKRGRPPKFHSTKETNLFNYFIKHNGDIMDVNYIIRFPHHLKSPTEEGRTYLSLIDAVLYWEVNGFQGFFDDLFHLADLDHWNNWEKILESQNLMRKIPCLQDMFIYECLRIHLGIESYAQYWRILSILNPMVLLPLLKMPKFIPRDQDFSDFFHVVPLEAFETFLQGLIKEIYARKLISYRILIWDCQFMHSNASDYKSKDEKFYKDRDAGLGRHNNKFLGVGYMVSTLYAYCGDIVVPVFCMLFPANINDKTIFFDTMSYYYSQNHPKPLIILADAGPYSLKNLRLLAKNGTIGMINAPKNIKKQNIIKLSENVRLNRDFLPPNWSLEDCIKIYNLRTIIERLFSHNTLVYHARRMNVRGIDQAAKHRYMILILDLLKVLACHKLGRSDLFQTATAFSQMRKGYDAHYVQMSLINHGFKLLLP